MDILTICAHQLQPGDSWIDKHGRRHLYLGKGVTQSSDALGRKSYGDDRELTDPCGALSQTALEVWRPDGWLPTPEQRRWRSIIAREAVADDRLADLGNSTPATVRRNWMTGHLEE